MTKQALSPGDFQAAASILSIDVPTLMAVAEVESAGSGFLLDGRPKILFEAHIFSRRTGGVYDKSHPNISSPRWNRELYFGGVKEYARLEEAAKLNRTAALESASWGMFQIMGFNHARCGFKTVQTFVSAMGESAAAQLNAFCNFVKSAGLDDELRRGDLVAFAFGYNGPRQEENRYAEKLLAARTRYVAAMDPTRRLV
jgi:hypothetical protein